MTAVSGGSGASDWIKRREGDERENRNNQSVSELLRLG